jgi:hypothetical protein
MSADTLQETRLKVPLIPPAFNGLKAAMRYAKFGWYVGPVRVGTKNPGSILGARWHKQTTRDPDELEELWAGRDHGVFLHAGRSGAAISDVDHPERLPEALRTAIEECKPPYQSTRPGELGRGHYLFLQPPGRDLGNSTGGLGKIWGEVRGRNGVIIAAPSMHPEGGFYKWLQWGDVPMLPDYVAELLLDSPLAMPAASDTQIREFLAKHSDAGDHYQPKLLQIHLDAFRKEVRTGASRHDSMQGHLVGAMKEAATGRLHAQYAVSQLKRSFFHAVTVLGNSGHARSGREADIEWQGLLAWAVAQAKGADCETTLKRIDEVLSEAGS